MTRRPGKDVQKFRLRPTDIAAWFRHRCDRNFRWNTVPGEIRETSGIGWGVPRKIRKNTRPGAAQLMNAGYNFEADQIEALISQYGQGKVLYAGFKTYKQRRTVNDLPFEQFINALRQNPLPSFVAQVEIVLSSEAEARFLNYFGLDPHRITLSSARPDLLELLISDDDSVPNMLRIWDYKAAAAARHEHFIQVAYYSYLLDFALREAGITNVVVDLDYAVIRSREPEPEDFDLAPYRLAVFEFLKEYTPKLLDTPASDAHFHVSQGCILCEYADHCRAEAEAGYDLSRIAYLTSESRKQLRRAGIKTHRELVSLNDSNLIKRFRNSGYDLTVNLDRYIAASQALEDGRPRALGVRTLLMPQYEDVRIIFSAELDPVTNTCFALGLKTFEGWDSANNCVIGSEQVFIAEEKGKEAELLLRFLQALNNILERVDNNNRSVTINFSVNENPTVINAQEQVDIAQSSLADFKSQHPRLIRTAPTYDNLSNQRKSLEEAVKRTERNLKETRSEAGRVMQRGLQRLHLYLYDTLDLKYLEGLIERNLFNDEPPGLLVELTKLVRLFPTESIIPDAKTFRSVPGTVVIQVLRALVALPIPYQFNLRQASEVLQPHNNNGEENGYIFRAKFGFVWDTSNQVAFERIHDVWEGKNYSVEGQFDLSPSEILEQIKKTILSKLRATDSIVRRLKQEYKDSLLLKKEPFQLYTEFNPLSFQMLEALRVFSIMENSLNELMIKHMHTLPAEDRNNKFICIRGLIYDPSISTTDGSLWFTFDPSSRDAKFEVGDYNLVVTLEEEPDTLIAKVDGKLFDQTTNWSLGYYKVNIQEYDLRVDPPRIRLLPNNPGKFADALDLTKPCVLDQIYADYNTQKILDVLGRLENNLAQAQHIHDLMRNGIITEWQTLLNDTRPIEEELYRLIASVGKNASSLLNKGQWLAFHGVFQEALTIIWGPPGTGKTHTLAHILLGYALAAKHTGLKIRVLVTAFTHHAIVNVMKKVGELADEYRIDENILLLRQLEGSGSAAHGELPSRVALINEQSLESLINDNSSCLVAGSTVWSIWKAMDAAGGSVRQWFDVVLIDEASQMKLPDALIAFSASRINSNIILAGDDQQLPPIVHGSYPEEHEHMLSSVFAFVRNQIEQEQLKGAQVEQRRLFQLEDNFRMNEPLTAYPREVLYRGRFNSIFPRIRIATDPPINEASGELIDEILLPNRPVVLCWYSAPRSITARNPIEAELIAQITERLSQILVDDDNGEKHLYTPIDFARKGLAVLSPHRAQNSAIRQALRDYHFGNDSKPLPLVDTVDKLQGKEREVILVSYGVADAEYTMAEANFLLSSNRFNVAITRAQKKVVVFCSEQVLNVVPPDKRVLLDSMMLKEFRRYCSDGHLILPWRSREADQIELHLQWKAF